MTKQIEDSMDFEVGYVSDRERVNVDQKKWTYTGASVHLGKEQFRIWSDPPQDFDTLKVVVLAHRQFKRYEDENGKKVNTSWRSKQGDAHAQFLFVLPDDDPTKIYNFGTDSYTPRASLYNPDKGKWHNANIPLGIFHQLNNYIAGFQKSKGVKTHFTDWQFTFGFSENKIKVGFGKNTQDVRYITRTQFEYVGTELAKELDDLYHNEELDDWVVEYEQGTDVQEPEWDNSQMDAGEEMTVNTNAGLQQQDDDIPF